MADSNENHSPDAEKSGQLDHSENIMSDKGLKPIFISVVVVFFITALVLALLSYWMEAAIALALGVITPIWYVVSLKTKIYFH